MSTTSPKPIESPSKSPPFVGRRIYCLLIGIDCYEVPGANLGGCVQDSRAVEKYLRESVSNAGECLHLLCLRSPVLQQQEDPEIKAPMPASRKVGTATRSEIIAGFKDFLTQAEEDDIVLVHYSGHGSYETRPEELWHLDPEERSTHRAETIVCQDSFTTKNGQFVPALRDKELRWLIAEIATRNPNIVLLMDCCNASGNTRFKEEGTLARFTPLKGITEQNDIASYLFYQDDEAARLALSSDPTQFHLPEGRHLALYACHSYQLAKETTFREGRFGVFTYYLLQTLRATRGRITYRDLLKLIRAKAKERVTHQSPQVHASLPEDMDNYFLGNQSEESEKAPFTLLPTDNPLEARLDAGSLHGLLGPEEGATFFEVLSNKSSAEPTEARLALLKNITPAHSIVSFTDGKPFPEGESLLKAIVHSSPVPKTKVCIELEDEEKLLDEATLSPEQLELLEAQKDLLNLLKDAPHLSVVKKEGGGWQYRLFIYLYKGEKKLRICAKDEVGALIQPRIGWDKPTMQAFIDELVHLGKWQRTLSLRNDHPASIPQGLVTIDVLNVAGEVVNVQEKDIVLKATPEGEPDPQLKFRVRLQKTYPGPLYCALLHLRPDFGINPGLLASDAHLGTVEFMNGGRMIKREQLEIYAGSHIQLPGGANPEGLFLAFSLPPNKRGIPVEEVEDHFKLIVSTVQFDPMHLWQNSLQRAKVPRTGGAPKISNAFDSLLSDIQHRGVNWGGMHSLTRRKVPDWYTTSVTVKTLRE